MNRESSQVVALIGLQFGDEGKGKIVDLLSSSFDYVVRYQGGDNAGHTIYYEGQKCVLRSIPSGIFNTSAIISPGTVVNPFLLLEEISNLEKIMGTSLEGRLFLSDQANVIFDFHIEWDRLCEYLRGSSKIGSTLRGIGPAYADKCARIGLKISDLFNAEIFKERLSLNLSLKNPIFKEHSFKSFIVDEVVKKYSEVSAKLKPYLIDYFTFISRELKAKKTFLLEGSQGLLLDIDLGTYPYVTSSNIVSSICHGAFFPMEIVKKVIGVLKVYITRVGEGPLLTELTFNEKEIDSWIREKGNEYGSNTLRARRIGWLDLPLLKYSIKLAGVTDLALTMVDVFSELENLKICKSYLNKGGNKVEIVGIPAATSQGLTPEYLTLNAWKEDFSKISKYSDFSGEFKEFVDFLESELKVPISIISFGRNRKYSILRNTSELN